MVVAAVASAAWLMVPSVAARPVYPFVIACPVAALSVAWLLGGWFGRRVQSQPIKTRVLEGIAVAAVVVLVTVMAAWSFAIFDPSGMMSDGEERLSSVTERIAAFGRLVAGSMTLGSPVTVVAGVLLAVLVGRRARTRV